jgi:hypothetical protein
VLLGVYKSNKKKGNSMYFINTNKTIKEVRNFNHTLRLTQSDPLYSQFKEGVNDTDEGLFICAIISQVIEITAHNDVLYVSECQKGGKVYTPSTLIISKECLVDNFYIIQNAKQILADLGDFSPMNVLQVAQKLSKITFEEA